MFLTSIWFIQTNVADDMKKIKGMGVELDNDLVIKWLFLPKLVSN